MTCPSLPTASTGARWPKDRQPRLCSADRLAQDILRGIDRNAALIIAPASARAAWYLWRWVPLIVNRAAGRQLAWSRATFARPAELADASPSRESAARKGGARDD